MKFRLRSILLILGLSLALNSLKAETAGDLFQFANLNYEYQRWEAAAQKYTKYLEQFPNHSGADSAWFRLGDCYRRLGFNDRALQCFETYLKRAPDGEFAGPASLSVARSLFNEDQYERAAHFFSVALESVQKELEDETRFFRAQALQFSNQKKEAREEYEVLLAGRRAFEYRERAQLELGKLFLEEGKKDDALREFSALAKAAKDPSIREESTFRAGILNLNSDDPFKAKSFLEKTLKDSRNPSFRQIAQIALMDRAYQDKAYAEVIRLYSLAPLSAKGQAKAQMELMYGNSLRHEKQLGEAIRVFGEIEREFPRSGEATEAGYRKLLAYHEVKDKDLPRAVNEYVKRQRTVDPKSPYVDLALLLMGETLFDRKSYKGAAQAYSAVRMDKIDEKYASMRLYKMGWAFVESGDEAMGIDVLGDFVAQFPKDDLVPEALLKRALTYTKLEDYQGAEKDFETLIKNYPKASNIEFAMHQVALIWRQERQLKKMVGAYERLLERFPNSSIRPEALFWIGGGLFDLREYDKSVKPLTLARELSPDHYDKTVSQRLVYAHFRREDMDALLKETDRYVVLFGKEEGMIPIYGTVGRHLYEKGDFRKAEKFLKLRSNPEDPISTPADIWRKLADVYMKREAWELAIGNLEALLVHPIHIEKKAKAVLDQATCQLRLGRLEEGKAAAEEVLRLVRAGRLNAEARVTLGDLAMASEAPAEAAQHYIIVAEFGSDPVMVPRALSQLVVALRADGKSDKASQYEQRLRSEFPRYGS
ncbi:MAG: tetratricopeptide repeat protein [Verrucomicrobiota bacterium]